MAKCGHDILKDIDNLFSTQQCLANNCAENQKKKRKLDGNCCKWAKKSVFFNLPYWPYLKIRHNIDIMHVVKNVTESVISTMFNIKGKSKDTWKSRKDLMDFRLKNSLHLQPHGDSFVMPMASYHFTKEEKRKAFNLIKSLRFPDGFASNLSRCIKGEEL